MIKKLFHYYPRPIRLMLLGFLLVSILISVKLTLHRAQFEHHNHAVELVLSYQDLNSLALMGGMDRQAFLGELKSTTGVASIGLEEESIEELVKAGKLTLLSGAEILNMARMGGGAARGSKIHAERNYLVIDDKNLYERVFKVLTLELGHSNVVAINSTMIEVMCEHDALIKIGVGLSRESVTELRDAGYYIVPRLRSTRRLTPELLKFKLRFLLAISNANTIVFEGDKILGYPTQLDLVRERLGSRAMNLGVVEFVEQEGIEALAKKMPSSVIRVHSIKDLEEVKLTEDEAISRYLRAVKERGVRMIFLKPFLHYPGEKGLIQYNFEYFSKVNKRLENMGYITVPIRYLPLKTYGQTSIVETGLIGLGVMSLLVLLLRFFYPIPVRVVCIILAGNASLFLVTALFHKLTFYEQLIALIAAVSCSTLALIAPFPREAIVDTRLKQRIQLATVTILKGVSICLLGALFTVALLSDVPYLVAAQHFFGVKLAFLIPLVLVGGFFYLKPHRMKSAIYVGRRILYSPVRTGTLLAVFMSLMFVLVYVLRSGNDIYLKVPFFETWIRSLLEKLLFVRPRTKEFLIGYPILFLVLVYVDRVISRNWLWFFMILGVVAYVSVMNSFCHIHTPLTISLFRVVLGVISGLVVGLLGVAVIELGKYAKAKLESSFQ